MMYQRYCAICGIVFTSPVAKAKYHNEECRKVGKREHERRCMAGRKGREYAAAAESLAAIRAAVATDNPARSTGRYATLAATPDEPALSADRGEQLTGGASAVSYAQSVRLVGVGI